MKSGKMTSLLMIGAAMLLAACGGGGDSGTTSPPITPTATLTVTLAPGTNSGTGTVTSNPVGLTCTPNPNPTSCTGAFPQGSQVTVTANPTTNHAFAGWSGPGSGVGCTGAGTCVLTMNAAKAVTATFNGPTPNPVVSLSVTGSGAAGSSVSSNIGGINCPGSCSSAGLTNVAPVTLTATAASGAFFQGWTGGSCAGAVNPCTFTPTADIAITATFIKPTISMTVTGAGSVSSTPGGINTCTSAAPCSAQFNYNSSVTLTVTIPAGQVFSGWSFVGAPPAGTTCTGVQNPCVIPTLTADVAVTAAFNVFVATPTVTINFANTNGGTGSVSSSGGTANFTNCTGPCVATYVSGAAASITAAPAAGSTFAGWTAGPCNGTAANPCVVNPITANQVMTAVFTRPALNLTMVGTGTVSLSGSVTGANTNCLGSCTRVFNAGELVTLTGSPTGGFAFQGWTGGLGNCTGGLTTSCTFPMPAGGAVVTATFNQVSAVSTFKFIGAKGRELLAINPASPGTPTPVQVGGTPVTLPNFTNGSASDGASQLSNGTYSNVTRSFTNIQANTIIFMSGGQVYKASALVADGVPGAGTNVPQQVGTLTNPQNCGLGSLPDLGNTTDRIIGFFDAGGDGDCNNGNEHLVLMHLNDPIGTAPHSLPVGTDIPGDAWEFNLTTGAITKAFLTNASGNLQWIDATLAPPTNVINGTGVGSVRSVGMLDDKVFLASSTRLYIYTPSTNTLSAPVVTADAGQTWVLDQWDPSQAQVVTDSNAIYLVQTNGHVYRVPLTTTAGQTIASKHFTAAGGTLAWSVKQTPNRVMVLTGTAPSGTAGQNPCSASNPTTCNNGLIAVDKTVPNSHVIIEAAASNKVIWSMTPMNSHITYTLNVSGGSGGALARIEDASVAVITVSANGGWSQGTVANSFNLTTSADAPAVNMVLTESTGPTPNGVLVKVVASLPGTPTTIGTVSDPTNLLQSPPFFQESNNAALLGFSQLVANPATLQPFFVDTTFNSLTKVTTPGAAAQWDEINSN